MKENTRQRKRHMRLQVDSLSAHGSISPESGKVAILIVTYNKSELTRACLASLRSLTYRPLEVYVIDNNSSDDTVAMIRNEFPEVRLICSDQNRGFAGGHRLGLDQALQTDAEFYWFLNNDTLVDPLCLSEMIKVQREDKMIGATGCVSFYAKENSKCEFWGGGKKNLWTGFGSHFTRPTSNEEIDWICGASLLMTRELVCLTGGFFTEYFMYYEDADLCFSIRAIGLQLSVAKNAVIYHHVGGSSGKNDPRLQWSMSRSALIFYRRHAPFWPIPVAIVFAIDVLRHIYHRRWRCLASALRGTFDGLRWRYIAPFEPNESVLEGRWPREIVEPSHSPRKGMNS